MIVSVFSSSARGVSEGVRGCDKQCVFVFFVRKAEAAASEEYSTI